MIWLIILQLRSGALKLERGRFGVCFLFFSWLITFWQIQCKPTILHSLTQFVAFKPMQLLLSVPTNMDIFANVDLCSYSAPGGIKYSKKSSNLRELRIIPPPTLIYQKKKKKREKVRHNTDMGWAPLRRTASISFYKNKQVFPNSDREQFGSKYNENNNKKSIWHRYPFTTTLTKPCLTNKYSFTAGIFCFGIWKIKQNRTTTVLFQIKCILPILPQPCGNTWRLSSAKSIGIDNIL